LDERDLAAKAERGTRIGRNRKELYSRDNGRRE
jgi:hypothetical protein